MLVCLKCSVWKQNLTDYNFLFLAVLVRRIMQYNKCHKNFYALGIFIKLTIYMSNFGTKEKMYIKFFLNFAPIFSWSSNWFINNANFVCCFFFFLASFILMSLETFSCSPIFIIIINYDIFCFLLVWLRFFFCLSNIIVDSFIIP